MLVGLLRQVIIKYGAIYILIVLFLSYGIVGTWKLRSLDVRQGWSRLLGYLKMK